MRAHRRYVRVVPLLLAAGAADLRAESAVGTAVGGTPAVARAHLDFRITVLPSLALVQQPQGTRLQAAGGTTIAVVNGERTVWHAAGSRGGPSGLLIVPKTGAAAGTGPTTLASP